MTISCIICAYNEELMIGNTLEALSKVPYIDEVVVVDDGSHDRTREIVEEFAKTHDKFKLFAHPTNLGKSRALATGFLHAKNDTLMLIDADLIGLTTEDIEHLAEPVISKKADVSISLRKNSLLPYRMIGLDFVSGERVFPREMVHNKLEEIVQLPRFGFEVFFNQILIDRNFKIAVVDWQTVYNNRKTNKVGFWKGSYAEALMVLDVLKVVPLWTVFKQNMKMLSNRVSVNS